MNEQDRNLVEQVVKAAGKAGEQGFEYLVSFTLMTGVVDLFGYAAWIGLAVFLGKKLYAWKPGCGDRYDNDVAHFFRGTGMVFCAIFVAVSIAGVANSITKILAPAGAAIHSVVKS